MQGSIAAKLADNRRGSVVNRYNKRQKVRRVVIGHEDARHKVAEEFLHVRMLVNGMCGQQVPH